MADQAQLRLPLVHVIAHDGSASAQVAYERVRALTEEVVLVFRGAPPPPDETLRTVEAPVTALTVDRILRTARSVGAPYVTVPASSFSAERILLASIDASARLATDAWPAVAIQVLRGTPRRRTRNVLVVASDGLTSGSLLLVATLSAALNGATLTTLVVGSERGGLRPGPRSADAELAATLRDEFGLPTAAIHLPERVAAHVLEREVSRIDADLVVAGMGRIAPGVTHRDFTRDGRRRLLAGPLRVEHTVLRSTAPEDAVIVTDAARIRRRSAVEGVPVRGLGEYFLGDLDRLRDVVRAQRQARNQAAEFGSS